jgi:hypothetical protein
MTAAICDGDLIDYFTAAAAAAACTRIVQVRRASSIAEQRDRDDAEKAIRECVWACASRPGGRMEYSGLVDLRCDIIMSMTLLRVTGTEAHKPIAVL